MCLDSRACIHSGDGDRVRWWLFIIITIVLRANKHLVDKKKKKLHTKGLLRLHYNFTSKLQNSCSLRLLYLIQDDLLAKIGYSFYCKYLPFIHNQSLHNHYL